MANLEIGQIIKNRYRIEQYLGSGGMADVFRVHDLVRHTDLAIKVMKSDLSEDREFIRRFQGEAKLLMKLQHPNIVRLYDFGQDNNLLFMVLDFIDGRTLKSEIFNSKGPLEPCKIWLVMEGVCQALNFAHQSGFVHSDVKPANIMINGRGGVFLADLGIARNMDSTTITMAGFGAPAYMSPEQIAGKHPSVSMDIYSLGVTLFEMLTGGRRPFNGDRAQVSGTVSEKVRWEQRNLKPIPLRSINPDVSAALEAVVMRCLEKDPKKRFGGTMEFLAELQKALPPLSSRDLVHCLEQDAKTPPAPPAPVPANRMQLLLRWIRENPVLVIIIPATIAAVVLISRPSQNPATTPTPTDVSRTSTPKPAAYSPGTSTASTPTESANLESSLSDDTCRLVYTSSQYGNPDIFVVSVYGDYPIRLTSDSGDDKQPGWSPDGKQIVFVSDRDDDDEIWIMDADGSNQRQLTFNDWGDGIPGFSRQGKIVFHSNKDKDYEIFVMDKNGNDLTQLTFNDTRDQQPAWSPDGDRIAFVSNRSGDNDIWLMDADGANQEQLTSSSGSDGMPSWSPDGGTIFFHSDRYGNDEIFSFTLASRRTVQITNNKNNDRDPIMSPDGYHIAFDSNRDGKDNYNLFLMNPDGSGIFRLVGSSGNDYQPNWSPICKD